MKKPNYFLQNPMSGEPKMHCGTIEQAAKGAGYLLEEDFNELQDGEEITIIISRKDMTDEEVEAIPEY